MPSAAALEKQKSNASHHDTAQGDEEDVADFVDIEVLQDHGVVSQCK